MRVLGRTSVHKCRVHKSRAVFAVLDHLLATEPEIFNATRYSFDRYNPIEAFSVEQELRDAYAPPESESSSESGSESSSESESDEPPRKRRRMS